MNVLNTIGYAPGADVAEHKTPEELGKYLQQTMLKIKAEHIGADGHGVDYMKLTSSRLFSDYVQMANQLVNCDPTLLLEQERMAFFINIYNCLTIHGLASAEQLPASVLELSEFWKCTAYSINGMLFSLDDIEHGVLRGNKPHPSSDQPPFSEDDPRRTVTLNKCDPRIHFTLVCGAKSCPAIQVYSAKNLERALMQAAQNFCSQGVEVASSERKVRLSKIFSWYGSDFADNERDLLQYVSQHVGEKTRGSLQQLLVSEEEIDVEFKDYNWQLNKL